LNTLSLLVAVAREHTAVPEAVPEAIVRLFLVNHLAVEHRRNPHLHYPHRLLTQ